MIINHRLYRLHRVAGVRAGEILRDFCERSDNSSVYEIEWEPISDDEALPVAWRYVGNASDVQYSQLLSQPKYIYVSSSTRGDWIASDILGGTVPVCNDGSEGSV